MAKGRRTAISRTVAIVIVVALVVALAAGDYFVSSRLNSNSSTEVDIQIIEDNPVLQLDHFYPDTVNVSLGQNITLAVLNGDDEIRVFTLQEFGINETLGPGTAQRITFTADKAGTFLYFSPVTPPSAVSQGRPGPYLSGNFTVS